MKTETDALEEQIQRRLAALGQRYPEKEISTWSDTTALQDLAGDLTHADPRTRRDAAFALGDGGDSRAILPLARSYYAHEWRGPYVLYDEPNDVRLAIALALFCLGEVEELAHVFFSESGHLKPRMTQALRELDGDRVVPILIEALSVQRYALSYWAARALGDLRDRRALDPLLEVLQQDRLVDERVAAADSLGILGDERAIPALARVRAQDCVEQNWMGRTVRDAATKAIDEILRSKGLAPRYAGQDSRYMAWVADRFQYEAETFIAETKRKQGVTLGYDGSSVAWLDRHIHDIRADLSPEEGEALGRDFGTFLGECLRRCHDGRWQPCAGRWAIVFADRAAVFPFTEVTHLLEARTDALPWPAPPASPAFPPSCQKT